MCTSHFRNRLSIYFIVMLALSGCGTTPVPTSMTMHVASEHIITPRSAYWFENGIPITIKRDSGFKGGSGRITFLINNMAIAELQTSERIDLQLPPGDYIFGVVSSWNPFNAAPTERAVTVRPGGITTYRIYFPPGDATVQIDGTSQ